METSTIKPSAHEFLSPAFNLLAQLWLREVDQAMAARLREPGVRELYQSLGGCLPPDDQDATLELLAIDYCQLLVGPQNHVSPIQSVWQDDQLKGESASSMRQFIDLLPDYEPPAAIVDHFGAQLDFVSKLVDHSDQSKTVREILSRFYQLHLNWVDPFFAAIHSRAKTDFYQGLASITQTLIKVTNPND